MLFGFVITIIELPIMDEIMRAEMSLCERASKLNKLSEVSQVALGMVLCAIKEQESFKELGYESFDEYYKGELNRSKGDISRLLTVGRFMIQGGFNEETEVKYSPLYLSIKAFPDKEPQYVLATAQTNTISEIMENRRDDAFGDHPCDWEPARHCKTCGKYQLHGNS